MELVKGEEFGGTFCPECGELVFHEIELLPTEIFCPNEQKTVTIPQSKPAEMTVTTTFE